MNTFMKRTGIVGAAGAAAAVLTVGMVIPAQATESHSSEGHHSSAGSSSSTFDVSKYSQDNDHYSSVTKILNDSLKGFDFRDNDRNGILNGDNGGNEVGTIGDIAGNGSDNEFGNATGNGSGNEFGNGNGSGNETFNGNDVLNGNEFGNVDTGDIASGDVLSGNDTSLEGGDVNVLNDAEILNDTLDVVDNTVSGTLNDVLNGGDEGSQWGGGDWDKW